MDLKDRIIKEATKWFRAVMRREGLEKHEQGLFEAVASYQADKRSVYRLPKPPPLPSDMPHAYSSGTTDKDFPAQTDSLRARNYDELPTNPVPLEEYEEMVIESVKKKDPYE